MHYTQGVFEASMSCARVQVICARQLSYPSQALECRLLNDFPFPVIKLDKAVNRATNLIASMKVLAQWLGLPLGVRILAHGNKKRNALSFSFADEELTGP